MNRLRLNPATGRLAERLPASAIQAGQSPWFTYELDATGQLSVELLTDDDVANWFDVVVTPRPPDPEFAYAVACTDCDGALATMHQRGRLNASHPGHHDTAPYAVRIHHPDNPDDASIPTFAAGTRVTFHGSTTDQGADLVTATIDRADRREIDGEPTDGYIITVDGRHTFVPTTAVHITDNTGASDA